MEFEGKYNTKSPAVKRLMREACELKEPTDEYSAYPVEDNLFEWHFTVCGPSATEFEGGVYHGRISMPPDYPMKPPNIILLTPNGRFEVNKKICLSISGHHPETWQPSWSIRTALLALIAFMPSPGNGTIGALDYTQEERQQMARKSQLWVCSVCGKIADLLSKSTTASPVTKDESDLIKNMIFKGEDVNSNNNENSMPKRHLSRLVVEARPVIDDKGEIVEETATTNVKQEVSHNNGGGSSNAKEENNISDKNETVQSSTSCPSPQVMNRVTNNALSQSSAADTLSNILIGVIVAAIAFLIYRRLFLI